MSNDIFLFDSSDAPQPREHVKITALAASPYPDGSRVHMELRITPFLERPNLEIYAQKVDGPLVAEMSVIETMTPNLEFTLHIRGVETLAGTYILRAELFYDDRMQPQDAREISFQIDAAQ
jgi:hypothetical protein